MSAERIVLQFLREAKEPISGQNIRIMMADRMPAGSVSAYLSRLVDQRLVFTKPIPNGAKGKLYWHKPFTTEATMTGAPNRPQAVAPAPSVAWPSALPSKRVLPAVANLAQQNLDRMEAPTVDAEPEPAPIEQSKPEKAAKAQETEPAPPTAAFKRRGYEFSLTRGPVGFDLPHDLSWQEIVTLAMMLDAYGQLQRHEDKVAA